MKTTHKVGTITLGSVLIIFGILFILSMFFQFISYDIIFKLWPIILIILGIEILIANIRQTNETGMIYDKTAIALIIILTFFSVGMAIAQLCVEYVNKNFLI
jgi:uncharacterized membrane protein HdeD (DUF308 family)